MLYSYFPFCCFLSFFFKGDKSIENIELALKEHYHLRITFQSMHGKGKGTKFVTSATLTHNVSGLDITLLLDFSEFYSHDMQPRLLSV